jgi:hypothetical protein
MAGAGTRLFEAGAILTANQVNTYLMDQVVSRFADASARDAAYGNANQPSLAEGRICYLDSTNKVYIYTGSAWEEIGSQIEAGEVGTTEIANSAVTTDKINDSAVTTAKIADGTIVNADINASAAIALSKLATGTQGTVVLHNSSGVPTATALSGDVTVTNAGVTAISSGVVINADINSAAAIALSKLASGTSAQVVLANSSGVPTYTTISGDVTVTNTGVTAIGSGKVTSDMIADGAIVNADINASAAIALSKLASGTSAQVVLANSSGVPTYTTISGDIAISNTGVATIQANSVALGTDTTGNYMSDITAGTGLTVTHTAGEGSTATVALAGYSFNTSSVAYTLAASDNNKVVESTASSAIDITVPPYSSVPFAAGSEIVVFQRGAGKVRILAGSGVTILSTPGNYLRAQYSGATLVNRDTNIWLLFGDLSAS